MYFVTKLTTFSIEKQGVVELGFRFVLQRTEFTAQRRQYGHHLVENLVVRPNQLQQASLLVRQNLTKIKWMNECLTTPQHEKQIGYWVSEKGKCMKSKGIIKHSVNSCAINKISQLGLFKIYSKIYK